jgi:hypothetical protein
MQRVVALAGEPRNRCILGSNGLTLRCFSRTACVGRLATGLAPLHSLTPLPDMVRSKHARKKASRAACLRRGNLPK